ncbi:hypothetical protein ACJX0J_010284, partial [Zea mays]
MESIIALYPIMSYMDVNQNHYLKGIILSGKKILHIMLEIFNEQFRQTHMLKRVPRNPFDVMIYRTTPLPRLKVQNIDQILNIHLPTYHGIWLVIGLLYKHMQARKHPEGK